MRLLILGIFLSFSVLNVSGQGDWKLAKDKNGVKVHTRTPSGSKIKEFKATIVIDAEISKVVAEIINVADHEDWIKDVKNTKCIKKISDKEYYNYYELSIPFPFDNRDFVVHMNYTIKDGVHTLTSVSAPTYIAAKSGIVRMQTSKGVWIITPTSDGKTKVFYQFMGDPGGGMPAWIVNMFVVDGPYESLRNLKDRLE